MSDKTYKVKKKLYKILALGLVIGIGFWHSAQMGVFYLLFIAGLWFLLRRVDTKKQKEDEIVREDFEYLASLEIPSNMPFPFAVTDQNQKICRCNDEFYQVFDSTEVIGKKISHLFPSYDCHINKQRLKNRDSYYDVYTAKCSVKDTMNHTLGESYSIALVDVSDNEKMRQSLDLNSTVLGLIYLDNYQEVVEDMEESKVPLLSAMIDGKFNELEKEQHIVIKKLEKDRYLCIMTKEQLEGLKESKFEILNILKDVNIGNQIPVTLSVGIGIGEGKVDEAMKNARAAIDLAIGRGGDQVLVKEGENYLFYGGKSGEVVHNARIRARVKADALAELISEADHVLIMGHKQCDLDSLGSSMGVYRIAKSLNKDAFIVLNQISIGVRRLYEHLSEFDEYHDLFVSGDEALKIATAKTLLVVLDTHRESMVEDGRVLEKVKKTVLFDHHRKSTDFIDHAVLIYHEPYASSTAELVTEMIKHINADVKLKSPEADALLGGITVDTKNFCMKTGAVTFEAAAYLRRNGADTVRVRLLFQNDMVAYKAKARAISDAEIFMDQIAISICPATVENTVLTAAQAADELLNIVGIQASFVLCQVDELIYCSARSLGTINVQLIMENLGGGGHLTMSGAQFINKTMNEATSELKKAIESYIKGGI